MRIIAFDIGLRRTGYCVSDPTGSIPSKGGSILSDSIEKLLELILKTVDEHQGSLIVIGIPFTLAGENSVQTKKVKELIVKLKEKTNLPVEEFDERLTSIEAKRIVKDIGGSTKNKEKVNEIAARLILEGYLRRRHGKK